MTWTPDSVIPNNGVTTCHLIGVIVQKTEPEEREKEESKEIGGEEMAISSRHSKGAVMGIIRKS